MFRRLLRRLFKRYQLMLLEPQGGQTVRNLRVNLAGIITIILIISLGSAALVWFYAPPRTAAHSARYYQLQKLNHDQRDRIASLDGEVALLNEQLDGLKNEMLTGQQEVEGLRQKVNIYESILEARKAAGVRILRATARLQDGQLSYGLVLVKGGNYPRSVSGSVRITASDGGDRKKLLKLGKDASELAYRMDTHTFLEGNMIWREKWQPVVLQITRLNYQGAERDHMEIKIKDNTLNNETTEPEKTGQVTAPDTKEGAP